MVWYDPAMSRTTIPLPPRAVFTTEPVYRFTVEQWHEMIDQGTLTADDPVELIEGVPVFKMPKNPPHTTCNGRLSRLMDQILRAGWHYRSQEPVTFADGEPEPDGAVVRGSVDDYADRHPGPAEIGLVIEIADSTLDRDRSGKRRSYARAAIGCYWIVNLVDQKVEVYTDPDPVAAVPVYRGERILDRGQSVEIILDGKTVGQIQVDALLPPV
jgi:Uma2 family endonuclease